MESEAKDGEEENLQSAFKKLQVDAEGCKASLTASANGCSTRTSVRPPLEDTKPKILGSLKESWHRSSRKATRGVVRTPRRRRSKSPILHPPKFTHCSAKTSSSSQLKHKTLCDTQEGGGSIGSAVTSDPPSTAPDSGRYRRFYLEPSGASPLETVSEIVKVNAAVSLASPASPTAGHPSDFQSVSKLGTGAKCTCKEEECQCKNCWQNMEVYSFSGLRDILSECEKTVKEDHSQTLQKRTRPSANGTSGSLRSCSEQARASVDDVTIEDLAGYMEYYLYIPKKMSHMAEMMYT